MSSPESGISFRRKLLQKIVISGGVYARPDIEVIAFYIR